MLMTDLLPLMLDVIEMLHIDKVPQIVDDKSEVISIYEKHLINLSLFFISWLPLA